MRKIITMSLLALGLTGGVAAADSRYDGRRDEVRDHREVREVRYRNYRERPAVRYERHNERRGYRWQAGAWRWNHAEWIWAPGYYVRIRF
jgi:hypothetical protein